MQSELERLEKSEKIEWKVFNLEQLFGKATRGRRLKSDDRIEGSLPFVTAGEVNTGISAFVGNDVRIFSKNTVTIDMFGSAKYRNYDYGADDHIAVVHTEHLNKFAALFVTSAIHKSSAAGQFDYSRNFYASDADKLNISLPVIVGLDGKSEIAFHFMEKCIATLEAERIATLEAYLSTTGLKDYALSSEEDAALNSLDKIIWEAFRIGDLFEIQSSKKKFNAVNVEFGGRYRYIARGESNNGIRGYITEDEKYLNDANTISFGQDTATMFYQNERYFTGDKIKIFIPKTNLHLDSKIAQIFLASMKKAFADFGWGRSSYNVALLKDTQIHLPIKSKQKIDYDFIENFVSAVQKIVIRNVVEYLDKQIEKTEEFIA